MTTNRLAARASAVDNLGPIPNTPQGWVDRGNEHLAQIGRAGELKWTLQNGQPHLQRHQ